jgi:hypothetical protein
MTYSASAVKIYIARRNQSRLYLVAWLSHPGLPDSFFSDQKSQFGYILEDLRIDNVDIYSGQMEYFTTLGYILWAFWYYCSHLVYFHPLWYIVPRESDSTSVCSYTLCSVFYAHIYHLLRLNAHFFPSYVNRTHLGPSTIIPDLTNLTRVTNQAFGYYLGNACGGLGV